MTKRPFDFTQPLILDGGLGTRLADRGNDVSGSLWSAAILKENPDEVREAHKDFFAAGANVATTCSYQVSFDALGEEAADFLSRTVELAREAADSCATTDRRERFVAASIGPYGAGPGEGTEYDGDYKVSADVLRAYHARTVDILAGTSADFLLAETVPNLEEVAVLLDLLDATGRPYAISISGVLAASPQAIDQVLDMVLDGHSIGALGVNCCSADQALKVVEQLRSRWEGSILAYPNSGETWDHINRVWKRTEHDKLGAVEAAPLLRQVGATMVGGCCRVTPQQISSIASA